jgi:hypothetical protein
MKKPDTDQQDAGQGPSERPRRSARKPGAEEYHIYFLPEGKGGERVRKGSVPLDIDPFDHIEERTDLPAGLYRVEKRRGGEFAKDVCHYTKEGGAASGMQGRDDEDEELPLEYLPAQNATDEDARLAKLVASTVQAVLDARDRRERAAQGQPDPMEQFRQMRLMLKEEREEMSRQMRDLLPQQNSAPARTPEMDPETQATVYFVKQTGALKEMLRATREVITTPEKIDEPQGWADRILDFAKEFVPYIGPVAGPLIGQRLISLLGKVDDATLMQAAGIQPGQQQQPPPPAQQHPAPAQQQAAPPPVTAAQQPAAGEEEAASVVTFEGVLEGIITDLQEGNEPDEAIDDIAKLTTLQPDFLPVIAKLIGQPNEQLVLMLSQAKGVDLTHLLNTDEYVDALRDGLKKRIRLPELPAEGVPTNNGTVAAARP